MDTTELDRQIAAQTITNFRDRFGVSHYRLAQYASLPLLLTPELVGFLRSRFLRGEVPWIAEADLLLSDLCRQVGYERFVMESGVKAQLLSSLEPEVKQEVALLLLHYTAYLVKEKRYLSATELETQQWSAMFYLDDRRETAVRQIVERFRELVEENSSRNERSLGAAMKQLAGLVNEFAPQLQDYPEVIDYARQVSEAKSVATLKEIPISSIIEPRIDETPLEELPNETLPELQEETIIEDTFSEDTLYLIAIGGSGAKCVESIIHVASTGLMNDANIKILFVDPDQSNGNYLRACKAIDLYNQCRKLVWKNGEPSPWKQTKIEVYGLWSPFGNEQNKSLEHFFSYNTYKETHPEISNLFDVLYTKNERDLQLDVGFRGRPAIGSAIFSQLDLGKESIQEPWQSFIQDIRNNVEHQPRIFLIGSTFGGTGASGFPTLGRLIHNRLENEITSGRIKLGGLLILPYFKFPDPDAPNEIYPRSEQFLLSTQAFLQYYKNCASGIFNAVYLLGSENVADIQKFSLGKDGQRNDPHFIELYGALAARNFLFNTPDRPVVLTMSRSPNNLAWEDLPDYFEVKPMLLAQTRFAYAWVTGISRTTNEDNEQGGHLDEARIKGVAKAVANGAPWLKKYFRTGNQNLPDVRDAREEDASRRITEWAKNYLRWLAALHRSANNVRLFNTSFASGINQLDYSYDKFSVLDVDSQVRRPAHLADILLHLDRPLNQIIEGGTIGIARALHSICDGLP
jgi:hypothetical protein